MIYDQPPAPIVVCADCTPHERIALNFLQEHRGITNKNALAVVMGNIKQETLQGCSQIVELLVASPCLMNQSYFLYD